MLKPEVVLEVRSLLLQLAPRSVMQSSGHWDDLLLAFCNTWSVLEAQKHVLM